MSTAVSIWLIAALLASAALKARRPRPAARALATYGLGGARTQTVLLWALVALELGLAAALALGAAWAAGGAAALFLAFTLATGTALADVPRDVANAVR